MQYARIRLLYVEKPIKYIISLKSLSSCLCVSSGEPRGFIELFPLEQRISEALMKFYLRGLREVVGEAAMIVTRWSL